MDISSLAGVIGGAVLLVVSIFLTGSDLAPYLNLPGLAIVVGGTICAALVAEKLTAVINAVQVAKHVFVSRAPAIEETIDTIASLAIVVRKEGLLALEDQPIHNPFLAKGVRLAVDGIPPDEIQATLRSEMFSLKQRHRRGKEIFKFMAATAPSMGMVGTLIGLVQMLQDLEDPSRIGPSMALALLTTLYGAVLAFMILGPMAQKLQVRSSEETANMLVIVEGLDSILKGENSRIVQEKLEGFLAPSRRSPVEG